MIIVLTGQPRHGKSQYSIKLLLDLIKDNEKRIEQGKLPRDIYCNIAGVNDDDTPIKLPEVQNQDIVFKDKKLWFGEHKDCPEGYICPNAGSVFIYDECHKVDWIKETSGTLSNNPTCISMNEHGHEDYIFILITQFPQYIHTHLRGLVEYHYHSKRSFGATRSKIYKWNEFQLNPRAEKSLKDAYEKETFKFAKKYQDCYKSASAHDSMKLHIPMPIFYLIGALALIFGLAYWQYTKSDLLQNKDAQTPKTAQNEQKGAGQGDTTTNTKKDAKNAPTVQNEPLNQETLNYLTKDELIDYVKTREKHAQNELSKYKLQVEKDRLEIRTQYDLLQKQLLEHDKQIQDFYARLELYKKQLPKNYEITKNDPALQVRAVFKRGNKCSAYNTHGDLMSLSFDECDHYLQAVGRVHKGNGTTTNIKADPVPKIMTENPNFGATPAPAPATPPMPQPDNPQPPS